MMVLLSVGLVLLMAGVLIVTICFSAALSMAKFCPCEENGTVSYDEIRVWVDKLIRILDSNHQKEMFGYVLGRLFAYAPKAADGHYPCEAVCQRLLRKHLRSMPSGFMKVLPMHEDKCSLRCPAVSILF